MRITKTLAALLLICSVAKAQNAADAKMNTFVTTLMSKMTLDEKIGQLNLPGAGDITTGQAGNSDIAKKIKEGQVGGLFNIKSVAKIKEVRCSASP
jgi:beta-glucosidase